MYQDIIDQMFLAGNEDRSGDMRLHPSSISGCERNALYSSRGEPVSNPRDVRFTRIMGNGTFFHEKLQAHLLEKHPGIILEAKIEYGPIKGSADALLPVGEAVEVYDPVGATTGELKPVYELQEYKTISPNGMRFLTDKPKGRTAARKGEPKPEHVKQARIYHYCLSKTGTLLTDTIRLVYINRDDWTVVEFEVEPWTEEQGAAQELVWASLEAHLMDETLPDQMPDDYWLCKMCEFRTTCKGWE